MIGMLWSTPSVYPFLFIVPSLFLLPVIFLIVRDRGVFVSGVAVPPSSTFSFRNWAPSTMRLSCWMGAFASCCCVLNLSRPRLAQLFLVAPVWLLWFTRVAFLPCVRGIKPSFTHKRTTLFLRQISLPLLPIHVLFVRLFLHAPPLRTPTPARE